MVSHRQKTYDEIPVQSSDDGPDVLSKPLGVIKISDRHFRESIKSIKFLLEK